MSTGIIVLLTRYSGEIGRFAQQLSQPNVGLYNHIRGISIVYGHLKELSPKVRKFVEDSIQLCHPDKVHICDGSQKENQGLITLLENQGTIIPLPKYKNCFLARTNPADTARVEARTFICTEKKSETLPNTKEGVKCQLGNWISPNDYDKAIKDRFTGCMKGRTMYVIPFSMGPLGSPLAKLGIQVTDSAYVVASMRIMTRMGKAVLDLLQNNQDFVRALHAVGVPKDGKIAFKTWPCDPERIIILHKPAINEIASYGSGYGGNSLLGKKCFALRIGSTIAKREGWLAEHMLILGITNPKGVKRYIVAAFPSACGKTNLAMLTPTLPGYTVECVGDDIAWMKFDSSGQLRAINPENGFFGVAPGTSKSSNPIAMKTIFKNTIFTNVAYTSDGGVYWEGLEKETDFSKIQITDWHGKPWVKGSKTPSSHPNSRFCSPAKNCPILDKDWEKAEGVPISAILFGGRRPAGVPLVYEARSWKHGVMIGAAMRSEATAAAEHKGKVVMHDPFAMRPFFGYNFGHYLSHWLSMEKPPHKLPKIFHVNWFRKGRDGKFLWPGFGENCRVIDWILRRLDNEPIARESPIGLIPKENTLNVEGLKEKIDMRQLFDIPKDFWQQEVTEIERYFREQLGSDLPKQVEEELQNLKKRVNSM